MAIRKTCIKGGSNGAIIPLKRARFYKHTLKRTRTHFNLTELILQTFIFFSPHWTQYCSTIQNLTLLFHRLSHAPKGNHLVLHFGRSLIR